MAEEIAVDYDALVEKEEEVELEFEKSLLLNLKIKLKTLLKDLQL